MNGFLKIIKENELIDAAKKGYFLNYSTGVIRCMVGKPNPFFVNIPHGVSVSQFYIKKITSLKAGVYTFGEYVNIGYPNIYLTKEGTVEDSYAYYADGTINGMTGGYWMYELTLSDSTILRSELMLMGGSDNDVDVFGDFNLDHNNDFLI